MLPQFPAWSWPHSQNVIHRSNRICIFDNSDSVEPRLQRWISILSMMKCSNERNCQYWIFYTSTPPHILFSKCFTTEHSSKIFCTKMQEFLPNWYICMYFFLFWDCLLLVSWVEWTQLYFMLCTRKLH